MEKMKSQAALQNPVCVFVANDLNMGLGKTAAQVAHAFGKAWLDRFELVNETKDWVKLRPVPEAKKLLELGGVVPPKIIYCPASFLPEEGDYVTSITDSGRTVFTEPTNTVSASSSVLGVRVQEEKRLGYNVGENPFKQAFFVNRKAVIEHDVSEDELIAELALMSFKHIIDEYDAVEGALSLRKEDPLYRWLTSAFGKTVVGTKKDSKFQELHDLLKEDMVAVYELIIDDTLLGMCTEVLDSGSIHGYTKYKTFNLLSNI